jgi:hypothetical protein
VTDLTQIAPGRGQVLTVRSVKLLLALVLAGLVWSAAGLAAESEVPAITKLRATPSKFCAKKSKRCHHPGTEVHFKLSTDAKVRGDITPRSENLSAYPEFLKRFKRGSNEIYLKDSRLTPGRWTLRLQGTNSVGTGGIAVTDVHVVKHD